MFLPPDYLWLEPVLIAAVVVFVISLIGNALAFGSRVTNAFVTALVLAVVFGGLLRVRQHHHVGLDHPEHVGAGHQVN